MPIRGSKNFSNDKAAWIEVSLSDAECETVSKAVQDAFERAGGQGDAFAANISWRKLKTDGIFAVMDAPGLFKSNLTTPSAPASRMSAGRGRKA